MSSVTMKFEHGKTTFEGDKTVVKKSRLDLLAELVVSENSVWSILKPKFNAPPSKRRAQNYLRDMSEAMLRNMYGGHVVHWDWPEFPVLMWFQKTDPEFSEFKDGLSCNDFIDYSHMKNGFRMKPAIMDPSDKSGWSYHLARNIQGELSKWKIHWKDFYYGSDRHKEACPEIEAKLSKKRKSSLDFESAKKKKAPSPKARFSSSDDDTAETPKAVVQHFYRHGEHYKDKVISENSEMVVEENIDLDRPAVTITTPVQPDVIQAPRQDVQFNRIVNKNTSLPAMPTRKSVIVASGVKSKSFVDEKDLNESESEAPVKKLCTVPATSSTTETPDKPWNEADFITTRAPRTKVFPSDSFDDGSFNELSDSEFMEFMVEVSAIPLINH